VNRRPDQAQNYNAQRVGFPQIDRGGIFRGQKEASNHGHFFIMVIGDLDLPSGYLT